MLQFGGISVWFILYELYWMMIQSLAFVVTAGIEDKPATVGLWFWMYDVVSVLQMNCSCEDTIIILA